jgi:hypothetical protein
VRTVKWRARVAPALWIPRLVGGFEALLGVDVTPYRSGAYVLANVAAWIAWVAVLLFVARIAATRRPRSPLLQRVFDDLSGRGIVRARAMADALSRLDDDDSVRD